jgi:hypothetical protein
VSWAKRNSINAAMLESYTSIQIGGVWNDYVAVFLKDEKNVADFNDRILDTKVDINNGMLYGSTSYINQSDRPEDMRKLDFISKIVSDQIKVVA